MNKSVRNMTINASLCAIIAILTFVPYIGYIPLGFTSVTDIHVVVVIGAILLGPKHGFVLGTFFGLSSLIRSNTTGLTGDMTFIWPWVSVLPRALFGFLTGLYAVWFRKVFKNKSFGICLAALCGTITHTILVFIPYFPTYCVMQNVNPFELTTGNDVLGMTMTQPLLLYCTLVFASSCIFETTLSCLVVTPICRSLEQYIVDPDVYEIEEEADKEYEKIIEKGENDDTTL